jgi:ribosomal protein S24E
MRELANQKVIEIRDRLELIRDSDNGLVARSVVAFTQMHELRTYAFKEEIRAKVMDDLLADERTLPLVKRILLDKEFTHQSYGENQAVARVYAIKLLEHDAKTNGSSQLLEVAQELASVLAQSGDTTQGRAQDLDDLVYAYAQREEPETLHARLGELASRFMVNEHTSTPIRNGLFFALKPYIGEEQARKDVNLAFDNL